VNKRNPDIAQELQSISPAVANLDPLLPYDVPAGYFETLPEQILQKARDMEKPGEEIKDLSPLLAGLKGSLPFEVPEGYFKAVPDQLIRRAAAENTQPVQNPSGKLVAMPQKRTWVRLAAAAVITAMIAGSAWYFTRTPSETIQPDNMLASGSTNTEAKDSFAVSDDALATYLDQTEALPTEDDMLLENDIQDANDLAILDLNEKRIQELLAEIPDNDLQAYVATLPGDGLPGSMN
jgi:hypothetical protein